MPADIADVTPLDSVIREYLTRLDAGETVAREEFLVAHPEHCDALKAFFESNDLVRRMAGWTADAGDTSVAGQQATFASRQGAVAGAADVALHVPPARAAFSGCFPIPFGQYRILKALGQGAMGMVYLAEDIKLSRKVALKVPLPSVVENSDHLARFLREARACGGLRHHNICPVYEVNEIDGIHYIAMAYIEGKPLSEWIRSGRRFSSRQIAVVVRKIALALEVAHRAGVIHRDLKPANVMIDQDGEPIVMDFGLARQVDSTEQPRLTQAGTILGTPAYMSPEQIRSELDCVGPASDVYSLGVILYELLTGALPYAGPMMTILMDASNEAKSPPRPSAVRSDVDPQLEAVCLRMLAKPLAQRYGSMKEVAAALAQSLKPIRPAAEAVPQPVAPAQKPVPKSPLKPQAENRAPRTATRNRQSLVRKTKSTARRLRPGVKTAVGGIAAAILLGVIVITIRHRDGSETQIKAPDSAVVSITRKDDDAKHSSDPRPATLAPRPITRDPRTSWHGWPANAPAPAIAPFDASQAKKHQEEWAKYLNVPVEHTNSIGMKFRLIPPGEFLMGSTQEEIEEALPAANGIAAFENLMRSEAPVHRVLLTQPLYVGIHEVTQGQFEKVTGQNPSHFARTGGGKAAVAGIDTTNHPVEMVSWNEAAEFCGQLSKRESLKPHYFRAGEFVASIEDGTGYRLLTEAEWEFGCRAGSTTKYWLSDRNEQLILAGWFNVNYGGRPHAVGELKPNPFGLCDVHGNVSEWVQDGWEAGSYQSLEDKPAVDPAGTSASGAPRVLRGGSWHDAAVYCRSSNRFADAPNDHVSYIGFRVSLPVDAVRQELKRQGPEIPKRSSSGESDDRRQLAGWHGWPKDAPRPAIAPFDAAQAKKHQDEWAKHLNVPVEYTNSIGMKFRLIPPGEFTMGSSEEESAQAVASVGEAHWKKCFQSEVPRHRVVISRSFYLGAHEVTQRNYEQVIAHNPAAFSPANHGKVHTAGTKTTNHPVENVSWEESVAFCSRLNELEKVEEAASDKTAQAVSPGYRLPTEAEWEYACRAGTTTIYWNGNQDQDCLRAGWSTTNSGWRTHEVGELAANPFGCFDLCGNVAEWMDDVWDFSAYQRSTSGPVVDPRGQPGPSSLRCIRGGFWQGDTNACRSAARYSYHPPYQSSHQGFRAALSVDVVRQALKRERPAN